MEDPGDFSDAIILCHLKAVDEAFLPYPCVPDLGPVCKHGDYQHIVHLPPVEEVKAADGVAKDADSMYGGVGVTI